jgi:hypothetical protein
MRSKTGLRLLFILILVAFAGGLVRLFSLRFESGDIYPVYSSFRADPLGCRAFYDSLMETGQMTVSRNLIPLDDFNANQENSLILVGAGYDFKGTVPKSLFDSLDRFASGGGNLVIGYYPAGYVKPLEKKADDKGKNASDETDFRIKTVDLYDVWGFSDSSQELKKGTDLAQPLSRYASFGLKTQSWHSSLFFTDLSPQWHTVYSVYGHPVIIERAYKKGRIVLCSDSYFLSNEALKKEANPALLAFLMGDRHAVIFEESHLGIEIQPGIAGLILKYRLKGFVAALALIAFLFVWKNSSYFIPVTEQADAPEASARDQASGLASLYKRHIPRHEILQRCVDEWEKTAPTRGAFGITCETREHITMTANGSNGKNADPVAGYREIHRLLSEGKQS